MNSFQLLIYSLLSVVILLALSKGSLSVSHGVWNSTKRIAFYLEKTLVFRTLPLSSQRILSRNKILPKSFFKLFRNWTNLHPTANTLQRKESGVCCFANHSNLGRSWGPLIEDSNMFKILFFCIHNHTFLWSFLTACIVIFILFIHKIMLFL